MRSIKANFEKKVKRYPERGSYINLESAVKGRKFSKETISKAFNRLVDREEYERKDKRALIRHLDHLSNTIEEA